MSEELNKELETEVTEEVKEAAPVETMEDYAAELEASYKTLNQRHIGKGLDCQKSCNGAI